MYFNASSVRSNLCEELAIPGFPRAFSRSSDGTWGRNQEMLQLESGERCI